MNNPLTTIDNYVLEAVDTINYAWNWTTGRNKTDLSLLLYSLSTGAAVLSGSILLPPNNFQWIGMNFLINYALAKNSREIGKREEKLQSDVLDLETQRKKNISKFFGYMYAGVFGFEIFSYLQKPEPSIHGFFLMSQTAANSLGLFMDIAGPLPPRKNCISRGIDNLKEKYQPTYAQA